MTELILSTSNIMGGGPNIVGKPTIEKSNVEFTTSLVENFLNAKEDAETESSERPSTNGSAHQSNGTSKSSLPSWVSKEGSRVFIPAIDWSVAGLNEERSQYDITLKLFYLPGTSPEKRAGSTEQAINLVLRQLQVKTIDLLIVSFPSISFESDNDEPFTDCYGLPRKGLTRTTSQPEDMMTIISTWRLLEDLKINGLVSRIGVAEFGSSRLAKLVSIANIQPAVNQINLRDSCEVPRDLVTYAKKEKIELLTHNDCTNILPQGTIRELLGRGPNGAGLVDDRSSSLQGEIFPQWVVKYTAVVRDRGVVENKGYFALANLVEDSIY